MLSAVARFVGRSAVGAAKRHTDVFSEVLKDIRPCLVAFAFRDCSAQQINKQRQKEFFVRHKVRRNTIRRNGLDSREGTVLQFLKRVSSNGKCRMKESAICSIPININANPNYFVCSLYQLSLFLHSHVHTQCYCIQYIGAYSAKQVSEKYSKNSG